MPASTAPNGMAPSLVVYTGEMGGGLGAELGHHTHIPGVEPERRPLACDDRLRVSFLAVASGHRREGADGPGPGGAAVDVAQAVGLQPKLPPICFDRVDVVGAVHVTRDVEGVHGNAIREVVVEDGRGVHAAGSGVVVVGGPARCALGHVG